MVHGDYFTFFGSDNELEKANEEMGSWYEMKVRGVMGTEEGDLRQMWILNREISLESTQ